MTVKKAPVRMAVFTLIFSGVLAAQMREAPPLLSPDPRYKADILVVVAHPDDETEVSAYLAQQIDQYHRRVAIVYGTRGNSGGDAEGYEQAAALGLEREIEARRADAYLGIMNVWFLNGPDTPGQNVLRSLETWNHGLALDQMVRLVRLTRPEVILTWLPHYVAGENHGDHQAAGVIATEAFDLAGDPTWFPEQVAAPRNHLGISNLMEGLRPWQAEKIYYFTDASHTDFLKGQGPMYPTLGMDPVRHIPYYRVAAEQMEFHLTQGDTGQMAKQALATGDFKYFKEPTRFIFGKSLVASATTADVFAGVTSAPLPYAPHPGFRPAARHGLSIELGGPFAFYHRFWRAHGLDRLMNLLSPEVQIGPRVLFMPVLIHNDTDAAAQVTLRSSLSGGWRPQSGFERYPVPAHATYPAECVVDGPPGHDGSWQAVTIRAESSGAQIGELSMRVYLVGSGLPE
ncbi:MAG TPA: PIG-L family deacetylase [Terriglobia bacterium]|nr:PIG-L family deacetylase [Terriglobia bacterium]